MSEQESVTGLNEKHSQPGGRVAMNVPDMTCGHCASTVRAAIERSVPNARAEIDVASHRVTLVGDLAVAMAAVRGAGYSPKAA